ncbi:hypothetical protein SAMN04488003_101399 [Loktanella fryxellensis]|uniref:HTH cro/C1-type domain-containing protein n=1 Tax=Loktanella fryxellensis TaxID=245187 RepID=A0A1H7Z0Y7_9RHOB|nr:XRE family transcriptional regulator [Loktanella fryxellensis]SEM51933.1 hypothetical protein SAMN04488003_101399 [Loktanella fryxellensis]
MDRTGSRIRARRMDAGIAQRDLAQAAGISASYLNLIEHDRRRIGGKLLGRLAAELGLEAATLAAGADAALIAQMQTAAVGQPDTGADPGQAADLAARHPGWARLIAAQARQTAALEARTRLMADRLTHDPALSEALHGIIAAVTAIQSTAAILTGDRPVDADWQARFHRNIHDEAQRLAQTSAALTAYFDTPAEGPVPALSPTDEMEQVLSLTGFHRPALEGGFVGTPLLDPPVSPAARDLLAAFDATYLADALALPLDVIGPVARAEGCDPLRVATRLGRPLSQVMRRLAVLPDSDLGLLICDAAGAIRLKKPLPGVAWVRGGLCPLWPVFTALGQPGRPVTAQVQLPGAAGTRLWCDAVADSIPHPAGPHMPPLIAAVMLVRPDAAPGPVPPVPVGAGCRVCPRGDCPARREPAGVTLSKAFDS